MYLGFWQLDPRKPTPLLGGRQNCASKVSKSGYTLTANAALDRKSCKRNRVTAVFRLKHRRRTALGSGRHLSPDRQFAIGGTLHLRSRLMTRNVDRLAPGGGRRMVRLDAGIESRKQYVPRRHIADQGVKPIDEQQSVVRRRAFHGHGVAIHDSFQIADYRLPITDVIAVAAPEKASARVAPLPRMPTSASVVKVCYSISAPGTSVSGGQRHAVRCRRRGRGMESEYPARPPVGIPGKDRWCQC